LELSTLFAKINEFLPTANLYASTTLIASFARCGFGADVGGGIEGAVKLLMLHPLQASHAL